MSTSGAARAVADLAACIRFFGRVPVPALGPADDPAAPPAFARSAWAVPLAGALLSLPAAAIGWLIAGHLPALVAGAVVVGAMLVTTGALHEDGLADTADGLGAGGPAERRLAIMHDSRIGTYGAAALMLALLIRAAGYGTLLDGGGYAGALALVAGAAASRGAMVAVWHMLPPARPDGLAAAAGRPGRAAATIATALAFAALLAAIPAAGAAGGALALVLGASAAAVVGWRARRAIGGQTGDILGATQQAAELGLLVGLLLPR